MLKNYLTIALRFMLRQKGFSLINISGLTIGIACSLLILLYIFDELNYDRFHPDAERIYRISLQGKMQGKKIQSAYTGAPLAQTLQDKSSAVESTVRIASWPTFPIRYEDRTFTERNLLLADSNFFHFFNFNLIEGNADSVLDGAAKLVITESAAKRYFDYKGEGDKTPLGKTMILAQGYNATISGIAKDPPPNSHFHFTCILSLHSFTEGISGGWTSGRIITYVKLNSQNSVAHLKRDLEKFTDEYINPELQQLRHLNLNQYRDQGNDLSFAIQPLLRIHLHSHLTDEIESNGDISYIYLFGSMAIFITLLACINFMNLSTARSATRAKEVGVRKAVGAPNSRLITQFLVESYFYIVVSVLLAFFIIMILIGPFNVLTDKQLGSSVLLSPLFLTGIICFVVIIGLMAGSYPAFYLTQFVPIEVLKGRIKAKLKSYSIRNVLVVFQFFVSAGLIIATLTVYRQLQHVRKLSLGFDNHNIVNLLHTANLEANAKAFKQDVLKIPGVIAASYCNRLPPNIDWQYIFRAANSDKDYMLHVYEMDYDHFETMKYSLVEGRFFSPHSPSDTTAVILNEAAAKKMKFTSIEMESLVSDYGNTRGLKRNVIGIMKDFNFQTLRDSIQPMAIVLSREPNWEMAIRIKDQGQIETIEAIHQLWKKYSPNAPFEYTFLDKNFDSKLETEKRIAVLFLLFTFLAILIACLGLFGLATFVAEQRTKEIGIRKVLGASVPNIIIMLNKDFLKLVLIANLLAWPATWLFMQKWLNEFAYHTTIAWWIFVVAGVATSLIALISVSSRAYRSARGNPVNSLRDE